MEFCSIDPVRATARVCWTDRQRTCWTPTAPLSDCPARTSTRPSSASSSSATDPKSALTWLLSTFHLHQIFFFSFFLSFFSFFLSFLFIFPLNFKTSKKKNKTNKIKQNIITIINVIKAINLSIQLFFHLITAILSRGNAYLLLTVYG